MLLACSNSQNPVTLVVGLCQRLLELSEENMRLCSGIGFIVLLMIFGMMEERRQEKEIEEYEKRRKWWKQDDES